MSRVVYSSQENALESDIVNW